MIGALVGPVVDTETVLVPFFEVASKAGTILVLLLAYAVLLVLNPGSSVRCLVLFQNHGTMAARVVGDKLTGVDITVSAGERALALCDSLLPLTLIASAISPPHRAFPVAHSAKPLAAVDSARTLVGIGAVFNLLIGGLGIF